MYTYTYAYIYIYTHTHTYIYSVMCNSLQCHGLYSLPGPSVHGILQARTLEWAATSRGSSRPRDWTWVLRLPHWQAGSLPLVHLGSHMETQETQVRSLGQEDPLEEGLATHSSILSWEISERRSLVGYSPWGRTESDTRGSERLNYWQGCVGKRAKPGPASSLARARLSFAMLSPAFSVVTTTHSIKNHMWASVDKIKPSMGGEGGLGGTVFNGALFSSGRALRCWGRLSAMTPSPTGKWREVFSFHCSVTWLTGARGGPC